MIGICGQPPAYDDCSADMQTLVEGWTVEEIYDAGYGVCDLGSGAGAVVVIDRALWGYLDRCTVKAYSGPITVEQVFPCP